MQRLGYNVYFSCQIAKVSKYDQYIKEFLLKNSELSIERIGTFAIKPDQSIGFTFDKKAQTTESLVDYVAAETGKSKVLISSDLASVFEEARQYANIGKAYALAGLGTIVLNRQGQYEFSTGATPEVITENNYTAHTEAEPAAKKQAGRNFAILAAFLIVALIAGGLGWGIYKYVIQKPATTAAQPPADTTAQVSPATQQPPAATPAAATPPATITGDTAEFKFIFETTRSSGRAYRRYDSLRAWKENCLLDSMPLDSGKLYNLYVKLKVAVKDTTTIKDSIQHYYARPYPVVIKR